MKKYNELGERQKQDVLTMINDIKEESIIKLYDCIINIVETIKSEESLGIIKSLPIIKPVYHVQTLFDLLREFSENAYDVQGDFSEVRKYIGHDIDVFIIVNMMNA